MATRSELQALAQQLRQPHGTKGLDIAEMMNETNSSMTKHALQHLSLAPNDQILELGHGNGGHLAYLMQQAESMHYFGLERSALMQETAKNRNQQFVDQGLASFHLYEGKTIPFASESFDKLFTINTIYFWEQPQNLLSDMYRVLKKDGLLAISFAHKSFMSKLPFTAFGFTLYEPEEVIVQAISVYFSLFRHESFTEQIAAKTGEQVERKVSTLVFKK